MSAPPAARLWEVDLARSAAIAMMVVYHAGYDVDLLAPQVGLDPLSGGWRALQVATGSSFLAIVGASLAISNGRRRARGERGAALVGHHARRAAQVAAAALLVSAVTFVALGDDYVRFGILHCIAVAMVVCAALAPLGRWNLLLAAAAVAGGLALRGTPESGVPGLTALGIPPEGTAGVDWYPLLPWLGPALAGLAVGQMLYPGGRRGRWGRLLPPAPPWVAAAGWPGRHALPIYLMHQPVLIPLVGAGLAIAGVEVSFDRFR